MSLLKWRLRMACKLELRTGRSAMMPAVMVGVELRRGFDSALPVSLFAMLERDDV